MSKYTTEVRFICETSAGLDESKGFNSIDTILTECRDKVFNFSYPIFDEAYRPILEKKILRHYYTREICAESVGLWKHFLCSRLNEIMPYYNKLYESELLQFNPLRDVDITKDHSGSGNKGSESNRTDSETTGNTRTDNLTRTDDFTRTDNLSETTGNTRTDNLSRVTQDSGTEGESGSEVNKNDHWDMYSDTPQGALTNVRNESYLTNARHVTDDGTGSTHNTTTTFGKKVTETDTGTVGHSGSKSNTGTQKNGGTSKNTGTVTDSGSKSNTGTQKNGGTSINTGTVTDSGTRRLTSGSTEEVSTTDQYLEHIVGKTGGTSYSKLLLEYRETFMNIDMMIIDDLSDLFFNLW